MILNSSILEINKKNLLKNYRFFKNLNKKLLISVTLKANAYGLGDKKIYNLLYNAGCKYFFVATLAEAISLRKDKKKTKIFVLNGLQKNEINLFKKYALTPIINSENEYKLINKYKEKIKFGVHIDTGINRLGINIHQIPIKMFNDKKISLVLSHLASADEKKNIYNVKQRNKFISVIRKFNNQRILFSLSNSHGALISKDFQFNLIRPGIGIYGGHNFTDLKKYLKPVVKLKAKIIQIKEIKKNEYIGYNQTYKTKKKTSVAIISIGYADGIFRQLSNKGFVFFKNHKFNIIGRVSMDTITIDISKNKKIFRTGEYVELINYKYNIDDLGKQCKTISHEILTSISNRVKRVYV